ncbi:MAG: response regulator transcription factor [Planctomycetes bacterium]|nr:response regulator transcription factor [Planctomycetota bacterium]
MLESSLPTEKDKSENVNTDDSLYIQPDVTLLDNKQWRYVQKRYHISPRELEVAKLVCHGFVNGDVAKKLNVKPGTVKTHLRSIYAKTHAKNRITMLLRFMDYANRFSNKSSFDTLPVQIVERKKQTKHTKNTYL